MKFDLIRPCAKCPFRSDVPGFLHPERATEIADALLAGHVFSCHATVDYDAMPEDEFDEEEEQTLRMPGKDEQHCAGAMIFLEAQNRPNQMMRIGERCRFYDRTKLDMDAPVFKDKRRWVAHMRKARRGVR